MLATGGLPRLNRERTARRGGSPYDARRYVYGSGAQNPEGYSYDDEELYAIYRGEIIAGRRPLTEEDIWRDPDLLVEVEWRRAAERLRILNDAAIDVVKIL